MALVSSLEILSDAQKGGYAIGAFNVENMEMAEATIMAADEMKAPVILQTTPSTVRYASLELYCANVKAIADQVKIPVVMHLDHGSSFELCARAFRAGYTSIMIDGSHLPLEENIALTKRVVDMCMPAGIPVEGEIGRVGGKEDDTVCENAGYTIPAEAIRFEAETGLSSMAVGVGTAHGVYKTTPVLNTALVSELRNMLTVPMVLHGASGLSDEAVRECIRRGICKVNFATELRIAYSDGIKEVLREAPETFDPKAYGKIAREKVKELVKNRIRVCGCDGKA
ncbi:class II fructose-bisphosphate aldolase [Marasmitruncus massiliensis]|uniref:class II fructose-bisphosphate aldolase n=1 Tax=Marasmitruncus massiliensis TaxID=1944642 RepID=UPI000C79A534|nr:class II fructose-bisphosphate aldolase [Marasmitruncus massiliensis]